MTEPKINIFSHSNFIPILMEKKEVKTTKAPEEKASAHFDIAEISELLKAFTKSNVNELKLEKGDFKITIKQGKESVTQYVTAAPAPTLAAAPAPAAVASAPSAASAPAAPIVEVSAANTITVKSPMIGTFYRSAGPGKPAFLNVGDQIEKGQVTCIVEAMKLFNEIESEISGKVVKILIDDASPVEYDQPLFLVELS
jgi:acetyl-CoA carboxylase biotin carboxyl carrier protein